MTLLEITKKSPANNYKHYRKLIQWVSKRSDNKLFSFKNAAAASNTSGFWGSFSKTATAHLNASFLTSIFQSKAERGGTEFRHLSFWAEWVPAPLIYENSVPPLMEWRSIKLFCFTEKSNRKCYRIVLVVNTHVVCHSTLFTLFNYYRLDTGLMAYSCCFTYSYHQLVENRFVTSCSLIRVGSSCHVRTLALYRVGQ